jgi:hypothetical protein
MKSLFTEVSGYELHSRGSYPGIDVDHSLCSVHPARIHRVTAGSSWGGGGKAAEA